MTAEDFKNRMEQLNTLVVDIGEEHAKAFESEMNRMISKLKKELDLE